MEDDLVCEYDSTWDTESDGDDPGESPARRAGQDKHRRGRAGFWSNSSSRNLRAARDMQTYRHGYPNLTDEECPEDRMPNLKFYLNEIKSSPDDVSIETFHSEWKTDYKRLERVHSYIQWLFPLREPGVNYMATELTKKEIQAFRESSEAKRRLLDSYELMLGFYGIQLLSRETGEVKRAENWRERFANLERNMHNNLRITRILKCLGELGFEHMQAPLVCFFLEETLVRKNLGGVKRSVLDYFLFAVRDRRERRKLIRFAFQHFEPKDKFVWCPRRVQKQLKRKAEKKPDSSVANGPAASDEGQPHGAERETPKDREDDPASGDPDGRLLGSSVDPEPGRAGPAVGPVTHGTAVDDGPVGRSSSAEPAEVQEEGGQEGRAGGSGEGGGHGAAQGGGPASDLSGAQDDCETLSEDAAAGNSKHVLLCSSPSGQAEKLPRTETAAVVTVPDHTETCGASGGSRRHGDELMDTEEEAAEEARPFGGVSNRVNI